MEMLNLMKEVLVVLVEWCLDNVVGDSGWFVW